MPSTAFSRVIPYFEEVLWTFVFLENTSCFEC